MKGSIIERNGSYRLKIPLGKNPTTGKYSSYFETFKGTRTEAQKRLRELLTQLDKGTFVKPGKLTLVDFLKSWLIDYVRLNESARTLELYTYITMLHIIPTLGNISLSDLKPQHLQHLYSEKLDHGRMDGKGGLAPRTVQLIHVTIHKSLEHALKMGFIIRNVADVIEIPKVQRHEMKTLSEVDLHLFLQSARDIEYYPLFYTYLHTAMRRGELLAIQWSNVDLPGYTLSVTRSMEYIKDAPPGERIRFKPPKTDKSRRSIALTPSNAIILHEHRERQDKLRQALNLPAITDSDLVFGHIDGSPYLPSSITHAWIKAVRRAGFKGVRLHDARHTHASIMLKKGVHPKIVSERLGHAGIAVTLDLYSHVAPGLQQAAAKKFDEITLQEELQTDKENRTDI